MIKRQINCPHCGLYVDVAMYRQYNTNSRVWVCEACGQSVSNEAVNGGKGFWIKADFMPGYKASQLPVYTPSYTRHRRCFVCGADEAELHHFAPRAYYGKDCERWPKAYLCKRHHDEWHSVVTPGLHKKGKEVRNFKQRGNKTETIAQVNAMLSSLSARDRSP